MMPGRIRVFLDMGEHFIAFVFNGVMAVNYGGIYITLIGWSKNHPKLIRGMHDLLDEPSLI
ncbi:hypothetical protein [Arthrobacter cryoconiti]|uniref:Uncharacterized protein n=1 Tax=Arthrobacter cryoconiti TaxID=748907 RepID=A0ABV8QXJ5_9MICC|nr:hypothetical protein [Arthrobacter cryoconiti]